MADIKTRYENALKEIQNPKDESVSATNEQKLKFYAFFQQAKNGPCTGKAPSRLNVVAKVKYDYWKALGNMTKEQAMQKYIDQVTEMYPNWEKDQVKSKL